MSSGKFPKNERMSNIFEFMAKYPIDANGRYLNGQYRLTHPPFTILFIWFLPCIPVDGAPNVKTLSECRDIIKSRILIHVLSQRKMLIALNVTLISAVFNANGTDNIMLLFLFVRLLFEMEWNWYALSAHCMVYIYFEICTFFFNCK